LQRAARRLISGVSLLVGMAGWPASGALTLLTYNLAGNGATTWSTNTAQVQAIGRQMRHLLPDVITFNEVPYELSWEMTNFVTAFLPGYALAMNSGTDGYIRSAILSRHPITRSQRWLSRASLTNFGYSGSFTRDLFEAQIQAPGFEQPLHVFTTHLKAGTSADDQLRRAAETSAITNFLATNFLPTLGHRPYVLAGDLNEDIYRPPPAPNQQPIQRLLSPATDLRLTTPRNPFNNDDRTLSIRSSLFIRYDYILPCGLLFSNLATNQVFRTDLLNPRPATLLSNDSRTASDHLPVLAVFHNPYDTPFRLSSVTASNATLRLTWGTRVGRQYRVEASTNALAWTSVSSNLTATTTQLSWSTPVVGPQRMFRVQRVPLP
jgi:endonuclease/exonuclease/phosphatase family metal-dependent hydrolase